VVMASTILWSLSCYGQLGRGLGEVLVGTVLGIQDGEWRHGTSMYTYHISQCVKEILKLLNQSVALLNSPLHEAY
jgi:hypothetical protein